MRRNRTADSGDGAHPTANFGGKGSWTDAAAHAGDLRRMLQQLEAEAVQLQRGLLLHDGPDQVQAGVSLASLKQAASERVQNLLRTVYSRVVQAEIQRPGVLADFWQLWLAFCWLSWGVLWFLFYLILAHKRTEFSRFTGMLCTAEGIYTGWIPGYLLVTNMMPGAGS